MCSEAMARRRKEDRQGGYRITRHVKRLVHFSPMCGHWAVPARGVMPARCTSSGSAVDVGSDAPAWAQRAARAADGGVVDVSRALSRSPNAPRIHAQRVAQCDHYYDRNYLAPQKLRREIQ